MALTQINANAIAPGAITAEKISNTVALGGPKISNLDYPGDDTAALPAGGQTIAVNGSGFQSGCTVFIDGTAVGVVSFLSESQLQFVAPAKATGLYAFYVVNPDGGTAILVPGMVYSGTPTWTTASGSLGTPYETTAVSVNFSATGDGALTYAVTSGSSLPTGLSLSSAGAITGTVPATAVDTTYTFNVDVIDSENQSTTRQFSITYRADVVTWSSPSEGTSFSWTESQANSTSLVATSAAGKSVSYSVQSGSLPVGVTISGSSITGTPSATQANTAVILRATAADTARTADRTLYFTVNPGTVSSVEYLVVAGGGGAGQDRGGGGGAGGYRSGSLSVGTGIQYTVTVGGGGSGATNGTAKNNGSDSVFHTITSTGGGAGGNATDGYRAGNSGGSGGGGNGRYNGGYINGGGGSGNTPSVSPSQGNNGGRGEDGVGAWIGGGGGGASAAGTDGGASTGNGGAGTQWLDGIYYAGGGGGGGIGAAGSGGNGGGGGGGTNSVTGTSGTANRGGGGGGGGNNPVNGGSGGSGIVIIRYADSFPAATSTTGSPTITTSGGYRYYKFTGSGSITF